MRLKGSSSGAYLTTTGEVECMEAMMAAAAGVPAFGLSEVPEDVLDPLAALLYGTTFGMAFIGIEIFLPGLFLTCSV
jgi:hypothetical protein